MGGLKGKKIGLRLKGLILSSVKHLYMLSLRAKRSNPEIYAAGLVCFVPRNRKLLAMTEGVIHSLYVVDGLKDKKIC